MVTWHIFIHKNKYPYQKYNNVFVHCKDTTLATTEEIFKTILNSQHNTSVFLFQATYVGVDIDHHQAQKKYNH